MYYYMYYDMYYVLPNVLPYDCSLFGISIKSTSLILILLSSIYKISKQTIKLKYIGNLLI